VGKAELIVTSGTRLTLMPECRCRTNFSPAFRHLYTSFNIIHQEKRHQQPSMGAFHFPFILDVQGVSLSPTTPPAVWTGRMYVFNNAGMPDCLASCQSGTGMDKNALVLE
jgi:hypothetical protein